MIRPSWDNILAFEKAAERKPWCMCTEVKGIARDGFSTCMICGGQDALGTSKFRPPDKRKKLKRKEKHS